MVAVAPVLAVPYEPHFQKRTPMSTRTSRQTSTRPPLASKGLFLAVVAVVIILVISLLTGEYRIFEQADGFEKFMDSRVPRTIALVLSGSAMAMCGLIMQMLTHNRFVEPTTTGTTEWSGLGLLVVLFLFPEATILARMVFAIIFAFIGTMVFFLFLRRVSLRSSLVVPIVGIMLGAVVSAITTYFALKTEMSQSLGVWLQGSFTSVYKGQYEVLWIVLIVVIAVFLMADYITVAGLGEDFATNVGVNYQRIVFLGTGLVAIATGVVTVVVGNLPFIGLIVPNIISIFRGDDLRSNLPWVCIAGIGTVAICDIFARVIISPFEMPVAVILGIIGAIVFISLIVGRGRRA